MNGQWEGEAEDLTVNSGEEIRRRSLEGENLKDIPVPSADGKEIARFLKGILPPEA